MSVPGETLVQLPTAPHLASPGLRQLYERVESGALPTIPTAEALGLAARAREKRARYPHAKKVGPYLLGKTIGEGSFAKVKEALHSAIGEKVAIKIIDKKVVRDDPYLRKNMRREASLLQSLTQHPNIISLYEVMETDNNFYMVLELCTGGALLDRICSQKCLLEEEAKRYVRQIVSAVGHMHQAGILHRDLKVENLLLDENNNIKIIDFGLSNVLTSTTGSNGRLRAEFRGTQCGSPAYAAPEIIANKRYGTKVDVWSIGVNTFAMVAGCLPFTVEPFNIKLLLRKINNRDMSEIPTHLSNDCKDFIKKLLHPDPKMRYSIAETMQHGWLAMDGADNSLRPRTAVSPPSSGRLSRMELESDILEYLWSHMGYDVDHVTNSVLSRRADEFSAIYYLLLRRRDRQQLKVLRNVEGAVGDDFKPDAKEPGISGPKLYDEATAMELAGRKNGSLHFKMAMLLEQETDDKVDTTGGEVNVDERPEKSGQVGDPCAKKEVLEIKIPSPEKSVNPTIVPSARRGKQTGRFREESSQIKQNKKLKCRSNLDVQRTTKTKNLASKISEDRKEVFKMVTRSMQDRNHTRAGVGCKLSIAHKINLTFKQSDPPAKNFANHFNYRKGEPGNRTRFVLAPTRATNSLFNREVVLKPAWRQADSVDLRNLKARLDGLRIAPGNENLKKIGNDLDKSSSKLSTQVTKDVDVKQENIKNARNLRSSEIVAKRRHLKLSRRRSVETPSTSVRRSIRKRSLSQAKLVVRLPGRPKTPVLPDAQIGPQTMGSRTSLDQKKGKIGSKSGSGRKRKKSSAHESRVGVHHNRCEKTAGMETRSVAPTQAIMLEADPPLAAKNMPTKTQYTKASFTNDRLLCKQATAETLP